MSKGPHSIDNGSMILPWADSESMTGLEHGPGQFQERCHV